MSSGGSPENSKLLAPLIILAPIKQNRKVISKITLHHDLALTGANLGVN